MLEQMVPFLACLWLHAIFVADGPRLSTTLGWVYVATRALYPLGLGDRLGRGIRPLVLLITVPNYLVIFYFSYAVVAHCLPF